MTRQEIPFTSVLQWNCAFSMACSFLFTIRERPNRKDFLEIGSHYEAFSCTGRRSTCLNLQPRLFPQTAACEVLVSAAVWLQQVREPRYAHTRMKLPWFLGKGMGQEGVRHYATAATGCLTQHTSRCSQAEKLHCLSYYLRFLRRRSQGCEVSTNTGTMPHGTDIASRLDSE